MLPVHYVDAFTNRRFSGNTAAVVVLQDWLDDAHLQSIAAESKRAETAFILHDGDIWQLRWFTPKVEVPVCGHATSASAWVIFNRLHPETTTLTFSTRNSGLLHVEQVRGRLIMSFPAEPPRPSVRSLTAMLDAEPAVVLTPDMAAIVACDIHGLIVTAPGDYGYDWVSRLFAPGAGISEDPVTGGAPCVLSPYCSKHLGKPEALGFQASPRGRKIDCRMRGDRIEIEGQYVPYLTGQIGEGYERTH